MRSKYPDQWSAFQKAPNRIGIEVSLNDSFASCHASSRLRCLFSIPMIVQDMRRALLLSRHLCSRFTLSNTSKSLLGQDRSVLLYLLTATQNNQGLFKAGNANSASSGFMDASALLRVISTCIHNHVLGGSLAVPAMILPSVCHEAPRKVLELLGKLKTRPLLKLQVS